MTKMAAMPIYGKNPSKIIFSETNRLISRDLGVRHRWLLKYSNVYINHDPVMTLTKFMAWSTWVACASELGKLLKCHLKEKANRKLANGQNIEDSEKRKWPKGLSAPALELNTIIFKHVYWYMQLILGERLQDHWSSGSLDPMPFKLILKWFFSEIMWPIKMIFYVEPFRVVALIFCSLYLGQMTHPNMVKTLQKSSSPEPMGRFTRNLVCSIGDSSPS